MKVTKYFCDRCGLVLTLDDPSTGSSRARHVVRATSPSTSGEASWTADLCSLCLIAVREDIKLYRDSLAAQEPELVVKIGQDSEGWWLTVNGHTEINGETCAVVDQVRACLEGRGGATGETREMAENLRRKYGSPK